mgnify:CR=1 FL=1|tara:strand:+ start:859 stop:1107 length:249 start_codon:yes stop_codon:yes gene_type:complete
MRDEIAIHNPDAIIYEPKELDQAILGISHGSRLVYSYAKLVGLFMDMNQWDEETAVEWMQFNITGAYLGKYTPIIVYDLLHD